MAPNPTYSALVTDEPNQMVQVAAPATLPEGYHFEASFEGNVFTVAVPAGGVTEGQLLTVPYSGTGLLHPTFRSEADAFFESSEIPMGRWRDGLCDCFRFGPFHPSFLCAWCMPQLLNAQVMTRLKLDWLGVEGTEEARKNTYRNVVIVLLVYFLLSNIFSVPSPVFEQNENGQLVIISPPPSPTLVAMNNVINISFLSYTIITMMRARKYLRVKYRIPETHCHGCEDFCCVFWFGCCAVGQMARHTADYRRQKAGWCTTDGLRHDVESLNVIIV